MEKRPVSCSSPSYSSSASSSRRNSFSRLSSSRKKNFDSRPDSSLRINQALRHQFSNTSLCSIQEDTLASEKQTKSNIQRRCQRRLSTLLHTHVVLIIVCSLSALDAICVIGQLICDILIMKEKLDFYVKLDTELPSLLLDHMPHLNSSIHSKWNLDAIHDVITGTDHHTDQGPLPKPFSREWNISTLNISMDDGHPLSRSKRAAKSKVPGHDVDHGILYDMTHTFHLGSMAILSLLLLETMLKIFAMGKKLKHHKLEIFDAIVVCISWALDVALWEGIWSKPGSEAATYLIYLLPWRVVRIVNSFVLVIQEKDHVQLKIVKQRLRQSVKKSKEFTDKASSYRHEIKALAGLCRKLGASESEIVACSPSGKAGRRGSIHSVLERAASLTFISTMSSMGSLPSLFDMGDSSSDDERPRDLERSVSQDPTLNSAFSSSTMDLNDAEFTEDAEQAVSENIDFDSSSTTDSSKNSEVAKDSLENRSDLERTGSDNSVPPNYHAAISKKDSTTHL